jgi:glycerol-3-phosphate dehydrogenase (NAD(P)+)
MTKGLQHFGVLGAGAWGTALSLALLRAGRDVTLWAHEPDVASDINFQHRNKTYLPDIALDERLKATSELSSLALCDAWLMVPPAQYVRSMGRQLLKVAGANKGPVIIAAKGIEEKTSCLLSDALASEMPGHPIAVLSGPSFAIEVARGQPAALTLAFKDK